METHETIMQQYTTCRHTIGTTMKIKIIPFLLFTALTTTPAENTEKLNTFFLALHTGKTEEAHQLLIQNPEISHINYGDDNENDTIFNSLVCTFLPVEGQNEKEKTIISTICSHPTTTPERIYDAFVNAISENTQHSLSGALYLLKNHNFPLHLPNKKPTPFALLLSCLNTFSMPLFIELYKELFDTMLSHASKKLNTYDFYTFTRYYCAYENIKNSCPYNYITLTHALENKLTLHPKFDPDDFKFLFNGLKKYNVIPSPKMWNPMKQLHNNMQHADMQ
ncbi:MAG TPA: hypothetical protein VEK38_00935 [Candidatus Bathyarchaeia archaeon]|nr:hypothetical protein [Candidatus Bathyarchaeia archaeon]